MSFLRHNSALSGMAGPKFTCAPGAGVGAFNNHPGHAMDRVCRGGPSRGWIRIPGAGGWKAAERNSVCQPDLVAIARGDKVWTGVPRRP